MGQYHQQVATTPRLTRSLNRLFFAIEKIDGFFTVIQDIPESIAKAVTSTQAIFLINQLLVLNDIKLQSSFPNLKKHCKHEINKFLI